MADDTSSNGSADEMPRFDISLPEESDSSDFGDLLTDPNLAGLLKLADKLGTGNDATCTVSRPTEHVRDDSTSTAIFRPSVATFTKDEINENDTSDVNIKPQRFLETNEEDLKTLAGLKDAERTKTQTKWAVSLFKRWLHERGMDTNFEVLNSEDLDARLRVFYAEVRNTEGKPYSKSAFVGIRAGINRYLRNPPFEKTINILGDREFHRSNIIFTSMLKKQKKEGNDISTHHQPISDGDREKLSNYFTNSIHDPQLLVKKVWFDITYNFARRGQENQRELKRDSFVFEHDDEGVEFVELRFNEATKNHPGNLKEQENVRPRIYASAKSNCPVASLKQYLGKLNEKCDAFFQNPRNGVRSEDNIWYQNKPLGVNTLQTMMKELSKAAGLSRVYTNHCVRATAITVLSHAGVEAREIMRISGHRNESSLKHYNSDSSNAQKRKYSSILQSNDDRVSNQTSSQQLGLPMLYHQNCLDRRPGNSESLVLASQTRNIMSTGQFSISRIAHIISDVTYGRC